MGTLTRMSIVDNKAWFTTLRGWQSLVPAKIESLGIAPRLMIACGAVLVLVSMTTYLARESSRRAAQQVALIESQHEPRARVAQQMLDAAAAFNQATLELANPEARPDPGRIDRNLERLTQLGAAYETLAPASSTLLEEYRGQVAQHELRVRELLLLADRRRGLIKQYWRLFDRVDLRVHSVELQLQAAQRGQKALLLSQSLGRIQDRFGAYAGTGGRELERALAEGEAGFREALAANEEAIHQHLAAGAYGELAGQFEQTIRARRALVAINNLMAAANARFLETGTALTAYIETAISDPARRDLALAAIAANDVAKNTDRALTKLGVATLAILLAISIATAYGVIIPVRKLVAAIRGLGRGKRGRRVEHGGGIYELDVLADAFNEMSSQLEQAEQQVQRNSSELEQRVDERTRQLNFLAQHDPLTRLPNRRRLFGHLDTELPHAANAGARVLLLMLDLDNFKTVNDTLGHHAGDLLLKSVGERLSEFAAHRSFVARLGGDEFTLSCEIDDSTGAVEGVLARLMELFQRAVTIEDHNVTMGVSVGAAIFPEHGTDAASLLRSADAALFHAKDAGRNRCSVYGPQLLEAASKHFKLEQDLRRALEEKEFELHYQPQINLDTLRIGSVEALIRWRHPDGPMMPGQFLAVAERSGLMKEISDWVLETAIAQVAQWRSSGWQDAMVAVNLSAQQLYDPAFAVRLEATLRKHGVPPSALEIELTESALQTGDATIEALHWLRSFGIAIALDDFGTGYSSLTSIEQLPLTRVKIDRSLVKDIDRSPRHAAIVRSVTGLCRSLGLAVTAEGIERRSQFVHLHAQGSLDVQGYFITRPMPAEELDDFRGAGLKRLQELAAGLPRLESPASLSESGVLHQLNMIVNQ